MLLWPLRTHINQSQIIIVSSIIFENSQHVSTWYVHLDVEIGAQHNKLEEMVNELSVALTGVKHEQEYMEARDRVHRASMPHSDSFSHT